LLTKVSLHDLQLFLTPHPSLNLLVEPVRPVVVETLHVALGLLPQIRYCPFVANLPCPLGERIPNFVIKKVVEVYNLDELGHRQTFLHIFFKNLLNIRIPATNPSDEIRFQLVNIDKPIHFYHPNLAVIAIAKKNDSSPPS